MKSKKIFFAGILAAILLAGCGTSSSASVSSPSSMGTSAGAANGDEIKNYTRYANYTPVKAKDAGKISGSAGNILVAYFSRSANTSLNGVDAVSSASLQVQKDKTARGNAQQIAEWIADETGGDLYPIQTMYTYPVDYDQTVDVGEGQDKDGVRPALINPIDLSSYDLIYLVEPIWHYTMPAPVVSFLKAYDLSGKTIVCFTTNAGSGFADTMEKVQSAEPGAKVVQGIAVSQGRTAESESEVRAAAADLKKKYAQKKETTMAQSQTIKIQINGKAFNAQLENNDTAEAFLKKLPQTLQMKELNGNEKYTYGISLPSHAKAVGRIEAGDLMLYGDDCLVVFYESFDTPYSYTRIGKITNPEGLAEAVGKGGVQMTFSAD
jgi:flavodoxin